MIFPAKVALTLPCPALTVINARGEHYGAAGEHEVGQRQQRPGHLWAAKWALSLLASQLNAN